MALRSRGLLVAGPMMLVALTTSAFADVAVPGPLAGVGLPALIVAGGAVWLVRKLRGPREG
jgi:hypothetical protein